MMEVENLVEITLTDPSCFLKIMESLTRMGVPKIPNDGRKPTLYQSCHILHKKGRYYIVHFKELLLADGKPTNFTEEDSRRRDAIAALLEEWKLCRVIDRSVVDSFPPKSKIKVIKHADRDNWNLEAKYTIGERRAQ